jgi:hypothetical protein
MYPIEGASATPLPGAESDQAHFALELGDGVFERNDALVVSRTHPDELLSEEIQPVVRLAMFARQEILQVPNALEPQVRLSEALVRLIEALVRLRTSPRSPSRPFLSRSGSA